MKNYYVLCVIFFTVLVGSCKSTSEGSLQEKNSISESGIGRFLPTRSTWWTCDQRPANGKVIFAVTTDKGSVAPSIKQLSAKDGTRLIQDISSQNCTFFPKEGFSFVCKKENANIKLWIASKPAPIPSNFKHLYNNTNRGVISYPEADQPSPWMEINSHRIKFDSCLMSVGGDMDIED